MRWLIAIFVYFMQKNSLLYKLDEAKKQGKKIAELRDQGHKYYTH